MTWRTVCSGLSDARIKSCRTPTTTRNLGSGGDLMESRIDLAADLNDQDDEGLGWSTLSEARDPSRIRPGVMLVAGNRQAQAVVRVDECEAAAATCAEDVDELGVAADAGSLERAADAGAGHDQHVASAAEQVIQPGRAVLATDLEVGEPVSGLRPAAVTVGLDEE